MSEAEARLDRYRLALRLLYGNEIADKTELYYSRGWYYVKLAQRISDDSVGTSGIANGHRAKQLDAMTAELLKRLSVKKEQG